MNSMYVSFLFSFYFFFNFFPSICATTLTVLRIQIWIHQMRMAVLKNKFFEESLNTILKWIQESCLHELYELYALFFFLYHFFSVYLSVSYVTLSTCIEYAFNNYWFDKIRPNNICPFFQPNQQILPTFY